MENYSYLFKKALEVGFHIIKSIKHITYAVHAKVKLISLKIQESPAQKH